MNIEQTIELKKIIDDCIDAYFNAVKKHPFFAHYAFEASGFETALLRLDSQRQSLQDAVLRERVSGKLVLDCELDEAQVEYHHGDMQACYAELAQCVAVLIRIMEMVERKVEK